MGRYVKTNELYHHGIKGQKWGVRRFQKVGGGLTPAGKKRYGKEKDPNKVRAKEHEKLKGEDRRTQMEALSKRKDIRRKDRKLAKYGSKTTAERMAITTGKTTTKDLAKEAAKVGTLNAIGKRIGYRRIEFSPNAREIGMDAVMDFVKKESDLRKLSESYNPDGTGKKNHMPAIKRNVKTVATTAAATAGIITYAQAKKKAAENKRKFESWGGNLLEAKYDSIVPVSESEYRVSD